MAMTPEEKLLHLQVRVAQARQKHEDLVDRHRVMFTMDYTASAAALAVKVGAALEELRQAQAALLAHQKKHPMRKAA